MMTDCVGGSPKQKPESDPLKAWDCPPAEVSVNLWLTSWDFEVRYLENARVTKVPKKIPILVANCIRSSSPKILIQ